MRLSLALFALASATTILVSSCATSTHQWQYYGSDAASSRYAPHDQIDSTNVSDLRVVWSWRANDREEAEKEDFHRYYMNRSTPIVIDGVMYTSTPLNVVAGLDAATGEELWRFDPEAWKVPGRWVGHRGVAYWADTDGEERILFGTTAGYLHSLDAKTGKVDAEFGDNGRVDLTKGMLREADREIYGVMSPPIVCDSIVVVGSSILDWNGGTAPREFAPIGDVRGFDVRTGEQVWAFHTIPHEGEFGHDTWETEDWERMGHTNVWTSMSYDADLGYVYLPVSTPTHDYYGGERPGDNLFGDSIVCLNARTGERVWHYQITHHGLWDYDPPCAPILVDIVVDGVPIKAVAQLTKQAFCFVFDRVTGEPVWPIEERPVPPTTVPGEWASPTQPFPTLPLPFDRQGVGEDDIIDFTPQIRALVLEAIQSLDLGPLYSPPTEKGIIQLPGNGGSVFMTGGAVHPSRNLLFVPSHTSPSVTGLNKLEDPDAWSAYRRSRARMGIPQDLPLTKPPYGRITAIDLSTGEHAWVKTMGRGPVDHPLLRHLDLPDLGWATAKFMITTPDLLLVVSEHPAFYGGDNEYYIDPEAWLWALDLDDGHLLGRAELPSNPRGSPTTYMADGRQYIAMPLGDWGDIPAEVVALALPREGEDLPPQGYQRDDTDHLAFYAALEAIDAGDIVALSEIVDRDPALATAKGYLDEGYAYAELRGATLLHLAMGNHQRARVHENVVETVGILLAAGADPNATTIDSSIVLGLTMEGDQLDWQGVKADVLLKLLQGGVDPNSKGGYSLWRAFANDRPKTELASIMVEHGAHIDLRLAAGLNLVDDMAGYFNEDGSLTGDANTGYRLARPDSIPAMSDQEVIDEAFNFAIVGSAVEAADFLLERGADVNSMPPRFYWDQDKGWSPLHKAIDTCNPDMMRYLLVKGADPDVKDRNWDESARNWANGGWTCLEVKEIIPE